MDILEAYGISPSILVGALASLAVFLSFVTFALPILAGNELKSRMKAVAIERDKMRARERARLANEQGKGRSQRRPDDGIAARVVRALDLKRALADEQTIQSLRVAGYRSQNALTVFLFARVCLPVLFLFLAFAYVFGLGLLQDWGGLVRLALCIVIGFAGFYAPVLYIKNQAAKRSQSITRAFPDALDLLLICVESGNSAEAAFRRVANEIGIQSVPLAEELVLLTAELSYLPDRRQAYENLAKRTNLESVRTVCVVLIQAERYGTPLGTALRTLAQENRDMRMALAEKKAAALPPKLTVPMILFFLPVLFAVILGPAVIQGMGLN